MKPTAKKQPKKPVKKSQKTVLCLRTCKKDGTSHSGFRWPLEVGVVVRAPDWEPTKECGHGLHGLLWGQGDADLVDSSPEAVGMVVEVLKKDVVDLTNKVKFPRCTIRFVGSLGEAASWLARETGRVVHYATVTAGTDGTATAGDRGTATAGPGGTATAGSGGEIHIQYYDHKTGRYRTAVGYVGEARIEPGVLYRVEAGKLVKVKRTKRAKL